MKKSLFTLCFFIGITFIQNVFSQEKYYFDYYTIYDFKTDESDNAKKTELNFSNSTNSDYHLKIKLLNKTVSSVVLSDVKNQLTFTFPNFSLANLKSGTLLELSSFNKANYDQCKNNKNNYYDIGYATDNDIKTINVKIFKDAKKTILINECFMESKPTNITKLQHIKIAYLTMPLWCKKFSVNNEGVITKSYFLEKGNKKNIRNLIEINKMDFTLSISKTKSTAIK